MHSSREERLILLIIRNCWMRSMRRSISSKRVFEQEPIPIIIGKKRKNQIISKFQISISSFEPQLQKLRFFFANPDGGLQHECLLQTPTVVSDTNAFCKPRRWSPTRMPFANPDGLQHKCLLQTLSVAKDHDSGLLYECSYWPVWVNASVDM